VGLLGASPGPAGVGEKLYLGGGVLGVFWGGYFGGGRGGGCVH